MSVPMSRTAPKRLQSQAGYSLIEMLVVLVILALIVGIAAPRAISYLGGAKSRTAGIQISQIKAALDLYRLDIGRYPSEGEGLKVLIEAPSGTADWAGPYLNSADGLNDPWGKPYHYGGAGDDGEAVVFTYGADGVEGGTGENKDVGL